MRVIYVDNNATTQVAPEVMEEMLPYFHDLYGNPSSMHTFGGQVEQKLRQAREKVASLIGATPDEIVFTSCGSESDNTAIRSAIASYPDRKHIITTTQVLETAGGSLPLNSNDRSPTLFMGTPRRSENTSIPRPVPAAHLSFIKKLATLPFSSH